ncbi:MAG: radical SAM protein [archaeon]
MKTLLIYPRFWPFSSPPIGLTYLASYMRENGLDVDLIDCSFDMTKEKLFAMVQEKKPDIIGIGILTDMIKDLKDLVKSLRSIAPNAVFVAGGSHPSALPEETFDYGFDIIVKGEGEEVMVELVKALKNRTNLSEVDGIYYKKNGKIVYTQQQKLIENLDDLPFPARDLLPMNKYLKYSIGRSSWILPRPSTTVLGSRGCPFNCTFCATNLNYGRKVRQRSPSNYVDEIEMLIKDYGVKGILFNDDTLTTNRQWVLDLISEIKKRKLKIKWGCNTRVNLVDKELLAKMKEGGCVSISFGVESGVQEVLNKYHKKGITLDQIRKAIKLCKEVGIFTHTTFIVGMPGETLRNMEVSIRFAKEIEPDAIQVSIATPFPKTELCDMALKVGKQKEFNWEELNFMFRGVIETKDFTPKQVRAMQKKFLREFYLRPGYIANQFKGALRSPYEMQRRVRGFYQLVGSHISPLQMIKNVKH